MELNKNLILAMLATGISANTFAANDSTNPEAVETRRDTLKLSEIVVVVTARRAARTSPVR